MNRQIQLNNDLAAQGRFPTQYQSYLAQIVGFFVIEDRVSKAAEALSGAQVRFPLIEVTPDKNTTLVGEPDKSFRCSVEFPFATAGWRFDQHRACRFMRVGSLL